MLISFGVITCLSIMEFGTTAALEIIRREDFSHVFKFVKPDEHRLKYGELEVNEHWLDDIVQIDMCALHFSC